MCWEESYYVPTEKRPPTAAFSLQWEAFCKVLICLRLTAAGEAVSLLPHSLRQRLIDIRDEVVDVLDANGQADLAGRDTAQFLVFLGELRVRRGGRVDHQ